MMTPLRRISALLLLVFASLAIAACGSDDAATSADLEFSDMWAREPAEGQPNAAIYGTVTNSGDTDVTITGVTVDAAVSDTAELHEVVEVDGLMTMREREQGYVVPAGGSFTFEPGGPHVMILGIDAATYPTDAVDITFTFDAGDPAMVSAVVRALDGDTMSGMSHDEAEMDMDHSGMDDDDMDHSGMDDDDMEMDDADG